MKKKLQISIHQKTNANVMRETRRLWRLRSRIAGVEFGIGIVTVVISITVIVAIGM
jgi:hypothetical protein